MVARTAECSVCSGRLAALPRHVRARLMALAAWMRKATAPDEALARLVEGLAELLAAGRVSVLMPVGRAALRIAASSEPATVGDVVLAMDRYPEVRAALETGRPVLVENVLEARELAAQRELIRPTGLVSVVAVPIHVRGTRAVLKAASYSHPLRAGDARIVEAAAHLGEHALAELPRAPSAPAAWRDLLLRVAAGVLEIGADGRVLTAEGELEARLGVAAEDLVGRPFDELLHPEDALAARHHLVTLLSGGTPSGRARFRLATASGWQWIEAWATPMEGAGSRLLVALRACRPPHSTGLEAGDLLAALPVPALLTTPDGTVCAASLAAADLLQLPVERLLGRPAAELVRGGDGLGTVRAASEPIPVRLSRGRLSGGGEIVVLTPESGERSEGLEVERLRRILSQHLAQEAAVGREREEVDMLRTRFLAWSAHELKTPLTVLASYLEVLLGDLAEGLDEEQRAFLEVAYQSAQEMQRLVANLTDMAALESGKVHLEIGRVDLGDAARSAIVAVEPLARRLGVRLGSRLPRTLPAVRADRERVEQVLRNLLENAVRFTPGGGDVELAARVGRDTITVEVRDRGVGIPEELRDAVFEPFVQALKPPEGRRPGTGLGLAICRRVAQALGARLEALPRPGGGTVLRLDLPRWPGDETSA